MPLHNEKVISVVVSYNRRDLLARALKGLESQSYPLHEIIVVDNGSTDGSQELARDWGAPVSVVSKLENSGGAGGFATGIAWAIERGADFVWLQDDDAIPFPDCLERLVVATRSNLLKKCSFVTPTVTDEAGISLGRNKPEIVADSMIISNYMQEGLLPIDRASFVGPLFRVTSLRETHPPLSDFFIWHDDSEFTNRLASIGEAALVVDAKIAHLASNAGVNAFIVHRQHQNIRNRVWWAREVWPYPSARHVRLVSDIINALYLTGKAAHWTPSYFQHTLSGLLAGILKKPGRSTYRDLIQRSMLTDSFAWSTDSW